MRLHRYFKMLALLLITTGLPFLANAAEEAGSTLLPGD